jgi:hypothetical protein
MADYSTKFQWNIKIDATMLKALMDELRSYDKDLYKEVTKALVVSASPIANAVGSAFPGKSPLDNWHGTNRRKGKARMPGYNAANVRRGVKAVVPRPKGFKGARFRTVGILRLEQKNAAGQVYDIAGSEMKNEAGERFIANLDKHLRTKSSGDGKRSRIMFPFTKKHMPMVEESVAKSIKAQNGRIRARLVRGGE